MFLYCAFYRWLRLLPSGSADCDQEISDAKRSLNTEAVGLVRSRTKLFGASITCNFDSRFCQSIPRLSQGHFEVILRSFWGYFKVISRLFQGYDLGHFKVMIWSFKVISRSFQGYDLGHFKVISRLWSGHSRLRSFQVMSSPFQGYDLVISRFCQGYFEVMWRSFQGHIKVISRSFQG